MCNRGEMQLADLIEIECRDDDALLLETYLAYEDMAMPTHEKWVSHALSGLGSGLIGLGVGLFAYHALGAAANAAGFFGIMAALVSWYLQRWRWQVLARKMIAATDTGGWGRIVNRFDSQGFEAVDALRHWRTDWRAVAGVDLTARGLTITTKGAAFVLHESFWPSRTEMLADVDQIRAWWQAATAGRP